MDGFPGSGGGGEGSRNDRGRTVGRDGDGLLPSVADFGAELDATTAFAQAMCEPPPTSRVGQLDALDMESEINEELLQAVARIAQPIAPALLQRFRPELELVLRALFFRYTIYHNKPSVGCQLQGLVYVRLCSWFCLCCWLEPTSHLHLQSSKCEGLIVLSHCCTCLLYTSPSPRDRG